MRQRELVINALRMRPDRIVLGEVRGEEALDMLQAMNTGHDGSLTTIHANNPREAIARIETMAMMGNIALPEKAIRQQIAAAVHLIVQVSRMSDGTRRVTHVTEITGTSGDVISMQDIFLFEKQGIDQSGKGARQILRHRHHSQVRRETQSFGDLLAAESDGSFDGSLGVGCMLLVSFFFFAVLLVSFALVAVLHPPDALGEIRSTEGRGYPVGASGR